MVRDVDALAPYLEARARTPFAWGCWANDCASYADGAVQAQTGRSIIRELGLSWTTARGAARVMKRVGGLAAAMDRRRPRVPAALAQRGDLGLVTGAHGPLLVVIEGDHASGPGEDGRVLFPRAAVEIAWSIVAEVG